MHAVIPNSTLTTLLLLESLIYSIWGAVAAIRAVIRAVNRKCLIYVRDIVSSRHILHVPYWISLVIKQTVRTGLLDLIRNARFLLGVKFQSNQ